MMRYVAFVVLGCAFVAGLWMTVQTHRLLHRRQRRWSQPALMGIGQVVTLRVPAERLRDVNRVIEQTAWGGYRTEFYATYDYKSIGEDAHTKALAQ